MPAIEIRWRSKDLSLFDEAALTNLPAFAQALVSESVQASGDPTPSATPGPTESSPVSTSSPVASSAAQSASVSTGAIAGIAVGAVLAGMLLMGGLLAWIRRRKKRNVNVPTSPDVPQLAGNPVSELEGKRYHDHEPSAAGVELPIDQGEEIHEIASDRHGPLDIAELPADATRRLPD